MSTRVSYGQLVTRIVAHSKLHSVRALSHALWSVMSRLQSSINQPFLLIKIYCLFCRLKLQIVVITLHFVGCFCGPQTNILTEHLFHFVWLFVCLFVCFICYLFLCCGSLFTRFILSLLSCAGWHNPHPSLKNIMVHI